MLICQSSIVLIAGSLTVPVIFRKEKPTSARTVQLSLIATDGKNLMYIVDVMLFVFITVVSVKVFYKVKRGDKYK